MKLLYDNGKAENYTMKEIYDWSLDYLFTNETKMSHWNASEIFLQFLEEKLDLDFMNAINQDVDLNNITFGNDDWYYAISSANNILKLGTYVKFFDWSATNLGTFFAKALPIIYKRTPQSLKGFLTLGLKALHHLFTIPKQEMSLIDIAYMYSLMDLKAMDELYTPTFKNDLSKILCQLRCTIFIQYLPHFKALAHLKLKLS